MRHMLKTLAAGAMLAAGSAAVSAPASAQTDPYLGDIITVAFTFCPRGFADANGQLLAISSNQALYSLYGTTYGGDGRTSFGLPDLRGRVPVSSGQSSGSMNVPLGARVGTETNTLSVANLATHGHTALANNADANEETPAAHSLGNFPSSTPVYATTADTPMSAASIGNAGGNSWINNTAPTLSIRYCVAIQGLFPPRS